MKLGALEAGGTKMVCAIGDENGHIEKRLVVKTDTPETTVPEMLRFFQQENIEALGIACFGPIDLHEESKTYGYITTTPKLAWANYPIVPTFQKALGVPVGFDTDVNGSLLGEKTWGAARDVDNCMYITIGTGVGAGIMTEGRLLHGMLHPEAGHILLWRDPQDHGKSSCPYHENCFEGLACGPAIKLRYGKAAQELTGDEACLELESRYIGQALVDFICTLSPQRIILGGGVMHMPGLIERVRNQVEKQLAGYIVTEELQDLSGYIVLPQLNDDQGILGALELAKARLNN
jgi:fructokinase